MSELFTQSQVLKTLSILIKPGAVFEVRALDAVLRLNKRRPSTVSGYFDNPDDCVLWLNRLESAKGIYVTLNPVEPACLARCANRLDYAARDATSSDHHILHRRWLVIDLDPDRPSGVSASADEKAAASNKAREIHRYLKDHGWGEPLVCDSGNGFHLLYRIDLPREDDGLLEKLLSALAARFDGDGVKLDRAVHNPSRIVRLYGTLAAKGDNTKERPYRFSKIIRSLLLRVVRAAQLRALVQELQPALPEPVSQPAALKSAFDVEDFLSRHNIAVKEKIVEADGTIKWLLKECPFNHDHVGGEAAVFLFPDGKRGFKCFHNSCADKHWKDFRRHFEPEHRWKSRVGLWAQPSSGTDDDSTDLTSLSSLAAAEYPAQIDEAVFYGLAGDIVRRIEPHTEADPVALLVQFLLAFGNVIGRIAHAIADGWRHTTNMDAVLAGQTSKGRKGTAWQHVLRLFESVDKQWTELIANGLSSGEGLIWAVRDPVEESQPIKEKGGHTGEYETVVTDLGVDDKRLLIIEGEFANVLKVMSREGNTLSPVIRSAYDNGNLRILTKKSPARATGAHISIIGHITREELRRELTETESANGFGNRFLWAAVKRSKCLPEGGGAVPIADLVQRLKKAVEFAETAGELKRDETARELWVQVYPELSEGKLGLLGAITARAEAQVLRLSMIYALLDCSNKVRVEHLRAALAVWKYCEDSARWIFETGTGNKRADRILAALKAAGTNGLTKWQITADVFNRHATKFEIDEALRTLYALRLARRTEEKTGGRPSERWFYKAIPCEESEESPIEESNVPLSSHTSHPPPVKNTSSGDSDLEDVSNELDAIPTGILEL